MTQSIFSNIKNYDNPKKVTEAKSAIHDKIMKIVQESKIYAKEKSYINSIQEQYTNILNNNKYVEEEISKLTFLYAVLEHNLKKIKTEHNKGDFRVGFIFFNDYLYVLKAAKQKSIPVYVHSQALASD
jgi:hypothetical protein